MNKRGLSEVLGYVFLIIIAVSVSVFAYTYLTNLVPKDRPECPEDIAISIEQASCKIENGKAGISVTIKNQGLFTIDAAYLRIGNSGRKIKQLVNEENIYIATSGNTGLQPGEKYTIEEASYTLADRSNPKEIEVEPAIREETLVLCENAIVRQQITCAQKY